MAVRVVVAVTSRKSGKQMNNFSPNVAPTSKRLSGKAAKKVCHLPAVSQHFYIIHVAAASIHFNLTACRLLDCIIFFTFLLATDALTLLDISVTFQ